jgi:hypothetical protein
MFLLLIGCGYKETITTNESGSEIVIRDAGYSLIKVGTYKMDDNKLYYAVVDENYITWVNEKLKKESNIILPPYPYKKVSNTCIEVTPISIYGDENEHYFLDFGYDDSGRLYLTGHESNDINKYFLEVE